MERGLTKNEIIAALSKSPHGKLQEYVQVGQQATKDHPEFMAHLIAWDRLKGQVRDAKVALPIVSLSVKEFVEELAENSLAHFATLGPREFLRAIRLAKELHVRKQAISRIAEGYLRSKEKNTPKWDRMALQHRGVLKELYALTHTKPGKRAQAVLFDRDYPEGSLFQKVAQLKDMAPLEAAGAIMGNHIPFLVALGALGKKAQDSALVLALIEAMSPTELVTNMKMLERMGVKSNPALKGALEKALSKAGKSKKNVLKTTVAAEEMEDDDLKENLRGLQEKQIESFGGVEGNWLVLGDKSGSMREAIELARHVAAVLAKMVKGKVWLVFFDTQPQTIDVTGCALDVIQKSTKYITAAGGTSIGCGLQRMMDENIEVDGIAIVSDGGENNYPAFPAVYSQYSKKFEKSVPVYLYQTVGEPPVLIQTMQGSGHDMQVFDLRQSSIDYYSIPNLVKTMRTNRYSLIDEIMATRLLKLDDVFKFKRKEVEANA